MVVLSFKSQSIFEFGGQYEAEYRENNERKPILATN